MKSYYIKGSVFEDPKQKADKEKIKEKETPGNLKYIANSSIKTNEFTI